MPSHLAACYDGKRGAFLLPRIFQCPSSTTSRQVDSNTKMTPKWSPRVADSS